MSLSNLGKFSLPDAIQKSRPMFHIFIVPFTYCICINSVEKVRVFVRKLNNFLGPYGREIKAFRLRSILKMFLWLLMFKR